MFLRKFLSFILGEFLLGNKVKWFSVAFSTVRDFPSPILFKTRYPSYTQFNPQLGDEEERNGIGGNLTHETRSELELVLIIRLFEK